MFTALIPWLSPHTLIEGAGPWALLVVCAIIFAETGLLVGFIFPGDTLLLITGLLSFGPHRLIHIDIWWVALLIGVAAFLGGESGYFIGRKAGPRIFERKETGLFSVKNVKRTNEFFDRFGALAVIVARFVPVVRTFAPVAAGVGHMGRRRYSVYNLIGALLWGGGLTTVGYLLGNIPPVANFVTKYIDLVLFAVVALTLLAAIIHYLQGVIHARRNPSPTPTDADVTLRPDELK
ncbi:MAG: rane-associated protein [Actinomycetota bacterium]|nr:rane-associated protein [Actinomycetota bacterium]